VANFTSISAMGKTLERVLTTAFAEPPLPVPGSVTRALLVRTEDFDQGALATIIQRPALSLFLYRVDFNKAMRAAWSAVGHHDGRAHLPLDLHFLVTPWADNAEHEQAILGRAMQCLEALPILGGPLLHNTGGFAANEAVQIVMEEVSTEAVMRIFDSLPTDYRLSVPYITRIVRLDGRDTNLAARVTHVQADLSPEIAP
jgi:hypothetical protein